MAVVMQGIGSMAALSSTDPLSSMRFHLQPRKSLPVSVRNASVFIVRSDGRFPGGVNLRRYSVKKLVPNAVAAPADGPASAKPGHELLLFEALREGLEEEMDQDPQVCVMGEDVGHYGGSYKVTKDLAAKYSDLYVLDIPIAENSFTGMAIGAALTGLRPIVEGMNMGFLVLAFNQI